MRLRVLVLLGLVIVPNAGRQSSAPATDATQAIAELRAAVNTFDFEGGLRKSESLVRQFPGSAELGALRVVLMSGAGLEPEARDAADALARQFPNSPWPDYAQGVAIVGRRYRLKEADAHADRALAAQPRNDEFIRLKALTLFSMGPPKEAEQFLDASIGRGIRTPRLLAVLARVLSAEDGDAAATSRALTLFADLSLDDRNTVWLLERDLGFDCGTLPIWTRPSLPHSLVQRAIGSAPFALQNHRTLWKSAWDLPGRSEAERRAEIESDIARLIDARPDYPGVLALAAQEYATIQRVDRKAAMEDRLLRDFAGSPEAEQLVLARLNASGNSPEQLRKFIARPLHASRSTLARAYLSLVDSLSGAPDSLPGLIRAAIAADAHVIKSDGYDLALRLADRKLDLPYGRRLTMEADTVCRAAVDNTKHHISTDAFREGLTGCQVQTHDLLGWIAFAEGSPSKAKTELGAALAIDPAFALALYHLGVVFEAEGDLPKAETEYSLGVASESRWSSGTENQNALNRLFAKRHGGSLTGFDSYLSHLAEEIRNRRRAEILTTRIGNPQTMASFVLERYGTGERVSSQSLAGKVAVINLWGVWCGPCVGEAPDLQRLYESIKDDPRVVFLTIDTNDTKQTLSDFMRANKLTYPVLIDDGWAEKTAQAAGGFPTTLFLDPLGRIVFRQVGATDHLVEEFTWRIEALKAPKSDQP